MLEAETINIGTAMAFASSRKMREESPTMAPRLAAPARFKVMIADDSPVYRKIVEHALCAMPFDMIVASTGRQALQLFAEHRPDIVILDRIMPDLTGPEFCRKLRSMRLKLMPYIVMLTGSTDKESVVEGLDAGADDYVTKPFHDQELLARVRVGLRTKELQRQIEVKNNLLEQLALTDELTGLPNRRAVQDWAAREFESASRHGFPFWVVMADLDRFKSVNDVFGHAAGDAVLSKFSRILKNNCRSSEICGRFGGEEFVLIYTHSDREGVLTAVERLRSQLEESTFAFSGCELRATASFGIAGIEGSAASRTLEDILASADAALYSAKRRGRNRIEVAKAGMTQRPQGTSSVTGANVGQH